MKDDHLAVYIIEITHSFSITIKKIKSAFIYIHDMEQYKSRKIRHRVKYMHIVYYNVVK